MRRQGFMNPDGDVAPGDLHDDLGWNDMGHDVPHPVDADNQDGFGEASVPEVRKQLDRLNEDLADESTSGGFTVADLESELTDDYDDRPTITTNSHGGLTPMGAEDGDYEEDPEDETADMETPGAEAWSMPPVSEHHAEFSADDEEDAAEIEAVETGGFATIEPVGEPDAIEEFAEAAEAEDASEAEEVSAVEEVAEAEEFAEAAEDDEPSEPTQPPAPPSIPHPMRRPLMMPTISVGEDMVPAREKIAFTLRLDKERHLKLRLASAVTNRSAQRLVTAALDQFLESIPEVEALVEKSSGRKTH
ncbi:hypothetical protein [Parasphingopyxis marina]|uniref:Uncharacterized protein n=1 Tax=Parasphingopyxis marina TaxID=2761622 RepID=A0A842HVN9_9SPHN|nr:hypothetical protein [Parasphingopyxis marina]MBC2778108.1 hypothetical protein [Parasphingopyxis marina]